jgi:hypothetical protein
MKSIESEDALSSNGTKINEVEENKTIILKKASQHEKLFLWTSNEIPL